MPAKQFHLGDILSVTTPLLLSPRHMDGVYDILQHMTRDQLWTHQLGRAAEECRPWLLRQHPWLAEINANDLEEGLKAIPEDRWDLRRSAVFGWLDGKVARHGEMHAVEPIHADDHERKHPYDELVAMRGTDEGIVVVRDETND